MNLSQHKLTIALVLSGLVHGLLMVGGFNDELFIQSPEHQTNTLYLEFAAEAKAASQQKERVAEETYKKLSARQQVTNRLNRHPDVQKEKTDKKIQADQLTNSAADEYQQRKQFSKPVDNHDALMQLVYQAISEHKHYPYMARRLGQQGKVTLNFIMHPDGQVTDVMVIESSRYSVLDRAAQDAVVAISPFLMAAEYLSYEKVFDIAVDFRLN